MRTGASGDERAQQCEGEGSGGGHVRERTLAGSPAPARTISLNPFPCADRSASVRTMSRARATPAQRRSDAAPLALVVAGWVLALAPLAHPLLAHGTPFLRQTADAGWVNHADRQHAPTGPASPAAHQHAPGAPEHLQLPLLAAAPALPFQTVMRAVLPPPRGEHRPVSLPRRWSQEQPQAP